MRSGRTGASGSATQSTNYKYDKDFSMISSISNEELKQYYLYTLQNCTLDLLNKSDEVIENQIFEEFDAGVITFLHISNLQKLFDAGYITKEILEKSIELRNLVLELQKNGIWNIETFKVSPEWKNILTLSDFTKQLLGEY
jgi:hypothetical protein